MAYVSFDLKEVHKRYGEIYKHILSCFYPAIDSTGFPERNLSVNFSKAYEATFPKKRCCTWFELQFQVGKKKNRHCDACIVDVDEKRIILIESKRFSNVDEKIAEVGLDIKRIQNIGKNASSEFSGRIREIDTYEIYGLILTDAWDETKPKKEVIQSFKNAKFLEDYAERLGIETAPKNLLYCAESVIDNAYFLLSFIWRVK